MLVDVSIPIDHEQTCDVAFCARPATRAALDGDGRPFGLCETHRPWAKFMDRLPTADQGNNAVASAQQMSLPDEADAVQP